MTNQNPPDLPDLLEFYSRWLRGLPLHESEWQPDLFSTFLSRKWAYHKMSGRQRLVKLRKEQT